MDEAWLGNYYSTTMIKNIGSLTLTFYSQDAGDFAAVAYFVLKNRCPDKGRSVPHCP